MIRIIFLLAMVLLFLTGYSQKNTEGYIVTSQYDTISGLITFKSIIDLASKCDFTGPDSQTKSYLPGEILSFTILEKGFFRTLEVDGSMVFAEEIVRGPVSLFKYNSNFYALKAGKLYLLKEENNHYVGVMKILLDCNASDQQLSLTESSLSNYIIKNPCESTVQAIAMKTEIRWISFGLEINVSPGISRYAMRPNMQYYFMGDFDNNRVFGYGALIRIHSSRVLRNYALKTGALFTKEHFYGYSENVVKFGEIEYNNIYINYDRVNIPVLLQFDFYVKNIDFFAIVGFENNILVNNTSLRIRDIFIEPDLYREPTIDAYPNNENQYGILASLGITHRSHHGIFFSLSAFYERNNGLVQGSLLDSNQTFGFMASIGI